MSPSLVPVSHRGSRRRHANQHADEASTEQAPPQPTAPAPGRRARRQRLTARTGHEPVHPHGGDEVAVVLDTAPGVFLRQLRLTRAAQLLTQQAGTVAEVAHAVSYRDADYFAKQFRETYGMLPSDFTIRLASISAQRAHAEDA
ncbi:MAG: helix-turn-helix domain-containing protein [Bacteroidota bacterium]